MKVLYILSATDKFGGATKSFMNMLKGLVEKGVTATVVLPDRQGVYSDLQELNIETLVLTFRPNTYTYASCLKDYILYVPRMIARFIVNHNATNRLIDYIRNNNIDIVHTNVSVINIGYEACKKLNIPHIYHFREYGDKDFGIKMFPSWSAFYKDINSSGSYSICITKDIQRHHKLSARSKVIYNGIMPRKDKLEPIDKEDYFLYAGHIQATKGLLDILKAYTKYVKVSPKVNPLYIAGAIIDESYYQQAMDYAAKQGLEDKIKYLGERSDILLLMQKSRGVIVSSRFEGFGRCMAEAMFTGCLVIGHDTGGTNEQFDNGKAYTGGEIG
ncbi:MAG: glycosyltransferase, partial [Prevotellaceae bacterium]|nr:glycosyltransferase [Prevotellaceae bacterium]